jgi:hypothetical protein
MTALAIGLHVLATILHLAALALAADCGAKFTRMPPDAFAREIAATAALFALGITLQVLA